MRQWATAVIVAISEASGILQACVSGLLATEVVLTDGTSIKFAKQAAALGAKTLMMIGNLSAPLSAHDPTRLADYGNRATFRLV
jgi:hypothetical protein